MLSLMLVSSLPPSSLETYCLCRLPDVRPRASSSTFLSSGPFVWVLPLTTVLTILQAGLPKYLSPWWDFCCRVKFREVFYFIEVFFSIIFSSPHPIFPCTCNFSFLHSSKFFLVCKLYSFCYLYFFVFHYIEGKFLYTKSYSYIIALYTFSLLQRLIFFF